MNVLLVMARDADGALKERASRLTVEDAGIYGMQSEEALAAVSELIAADTEYDRARAAWLADNGNHGEFLATRTAWDRRAAALARVKGGAA